MLLTQSVQTIWQGRSERLRRVCRHTADRTHSPHTQQRFGIKDLRRKLEGLWARRQKAIKSRFPAQLRCRNTCLGAIIGRVQIITANSQSRDCNSISRFLPRLHLWTLLPNRAWCPHLLHHKAWFNRLSAPICTVQHDHGWGLKHWRQRWSLNRWSQKSAVHKNKRNHYNIKDVKPQKRFYFSFLEFCQELKVQFTTKSTIHVFLLACSVS